MGINRKKHYGGLLKWIKTDTIVIFGAGHYGCMLCRRLLKDIPSERIVFCGNSTRKQGKEIVGCKV